MAYRLLRGGGVMRTADGASIPPDPSNRDWAAYQAWLAAGNVPEPAETEPDREPDRDVVTLEGLRAVDAELQAATTIVQLRTGFRKALGVMATRFERPGTSGGGTP